MMQQTNEARTGTPEVILPAAERQQADAMLKTSRDMSKDDQRFALAFLRGMRFQKALDAARRCGVWCRVAWDGQRIPCCGNIRFAQFPQQGFVQNALLRELRQCSKIIKEGGE